MEEAAACTVSAPFRPMLEGLLEEPFRREVQGFVDRQCGAFAVVCADGSYPLEWTSIHRQYQMMFERQLASVVNEEGFSRDDFREYCVDLQQTAVNLSEEDVLPDLPHIRVGEFWEFLQALTASSEFDKFTHVMYRAVQARHAESLGVGADAAANDVPDLARVQVVVPEGFHPGQLFAVDYLGVQYELVVPDGCSPGSVFTANLMPPA